MAYNGLAYKEMQCNFHLRIDSGFVTSKVVAGLAIVQCTLSLVASLAYYCFTVKV
jgi:hypothetical protein